MIDSISPKHTTTLLTPDRLMQLGATQKRSTRNPTWFLNPPVGSYAPRITISLTQEPRYHVYAECSLPRLLYGHNARLPDTEAEVNRGLRMICNYVESVMDIPFDPNTAIISKLHLARDYSLGDAANNAVLYLYDKRLKRFPKRTLTSEDNATTLYHNYASARRNCVICMYSKYAEVLGKNGSCDALDAALGNLRIEYRANNATGIKSLCKVFSVQDATTTGGLLSRHLNDTIFASLETELHFPGCLGDHESALAKLLAIYPTTKAQRLFGFREMRRLKGDAALTRTPREKRNFNAARLDCERAGVWLNVGESKSNLIQGVPTTNNLYGSGKIHHLE